MLLCPLGAKLWSELTGASSKTAYPDICRLAKNSFAWTRGFLAPANYPCPSAQEAAQRAEDDAGLLAGRQHRPPDGPPRCLPGGRWQRVSSPQANVIPRTSDPNGVIPPPDLPVSQMTSSFLAVFQTPSGMFVDSPTQGCIPKTGNADANATSIFSPKKTSKCGWDVDMLGHGSFLGGRPFGQPNIEVETEYWAAPGSAGQESFRGGRGGTSRKRAGVVGELRPPHQQDGGGAGGVSR